MSSTLIAIQLFKDKFCTRRDEKSELKDGEHRVKQDLNMLRIVQIIKKLQVSVAACLESMEGQPSLLERIRDDYFDFIKLNASEKSESKNSKYLEFLDGLQTKPEPAFCPMAAIASSLR